MMTLRETVRNFHHKQYDLTLLAEEGNEILGYCDYSLFNNTISIQMIEVKPEYRLKGVARKMLDWVNEEYSDKRIEYGYSTDDGAKFLNAYRQKEEMVSENLNQAVKLLNQHKIDLNDKNYLKLKSALKDNLGYLGVFTNFLVNDIDVNELIMFYNELKSNEKYIPYLKHKIIEYQDFEKLLDDWAIAKTKHDAKKVLSQFYKEFQTKSLDDSIFRGYAQQFVAMKEEKQKMFLKTQKYYRENNVSTEKFFKDFYSYIDSNGKTAEEIRNEILQNKGKLKVLVDADNILVIQTNNKEVIQKFGSQSWCIVYSDSYYNQYVNYNIQFMIFNFNVPLASPESLYGVTISMNTFEPVHGGCQNKLNQDVAMSEIEKACNLEEGYLSNYVAGIASNLYHEVDKNFENFAKLFKKYKAIELRHYICDRLKTKFSNKSLAKADSMTFVANIVKEAKEAGIKLTDVINERDLSKHLDMQLTLQDVTSNLQTLYYLVDNNISLRYSIMFHEDAVFVSFMTHLQKNVEKNSYDRFITHFLNQLTLEKLNAFDDENFDFAMKAVKSNVKDLLTKSITNFSNIIRMMKEFLKHEHVYLKNFNTDFILKNQQVLELSDSEMLRNISAIYFSEENLPDYLKDLSKIEKTKGADFTYDVRKEVAAKYFNVKSKYEEKKIDSSNAKDLCKIFLDVVATKVVSSKDIITILKLDDLIGQFAINHESNKLSKEMVEKFLTALEQLQMETVDIIKTFYNYDKATMVERMTIAKRLLKASNYTGLSSDESLKNKSEQFALDIAKCFNEEDFSFNPKDLAAISKKLKLNYNIDEKAFEFKMPNLNRLKDIVIYDDEFDIQLDHKEGEKYEHATSADFSEYYAKVSNENKNLLASKNKEKLVIDAVNIAFADELYKQLVNAVFNKMFKTGYFKQWSDGRKYHIEDDKYVILITDKFIKPAIINSTILYNEYRDMSYATYATVVNVMEDRTLFIELEESDFDLKLDTKHFNHVLRDLINN